MKDFLKYAGMGFLFVMFPIAILALGIVKAPIIGALIFALVGVGFFVFFCYATGYAFFSPHPEQEAMKSGSTRPYPELPEGSIACGGVLINNREMTPRPKPPINKNDTPKPALPKPRRS